MDWDKNELAKLEAVQKNTILAYCINLPHSSKATNLRLKISLHLLTDLDKIITDTEDKLHRNTRKTKPSWL